MNLIWADFKKTILNTLTFSCCLHRKIINENMIKRAFNLVKHLDSEWMCHLNHKRTSAVSSLMNFVLWGFLQNVPVWAINNIPCFMNIYSSVHMCAHEMYCSVIDQEFDLLFLCVFLSQDFLVQSEEAVFQLWCQQTLPGHHWEGSLLCNLRRWRARYEGRWPCWKLGPLCQVPAAWQMLW